MSSNELFKPIGEIASQTDALPEVPDDDVRLQDDGAQPDFQDGEEREVQQIESLCMECGEQVGRGQALS
jgi:zinc finger protein